MKEKLNENYKSKKGKNKHTGVRKIIDRQRIETKQ